MTGSAVVRAAALVLAGIAFAAVTARPAAARVPATGRWHEPSATPTPTPTPIVAAPARGATLPTATAKPAPVRGRTAAAAAAGPSAALLGPLVLDPIPSPIVVGGQTTLTGTGFTAGSVIVGFVQTGLGVQSLGPYTPLSFTATQLVWNVSPSIPLGQGFVVLAVVNTDEGFRGTAYQSQRLYGDVAHNIPTILSINGNAILGPDGALNGIYVNVSLAASTWVTIGGTGFNNPGVNFYTAAGNLGPLPTRNVTATQMEARVPDSAPLGLAAFELVNNPYTGNVGSQVVYASLGGPPTIASIMQTGSTVTVTGTGFATGAVINLFNVRGGSIANLGSVWPTDGQPRTPVTIVSPTQLTFTVPPDAVTGPAYLQIINPPYIGFTATGNDPHGGFVMTGTQAARGGGSLRFFGNGSSDIDRVKIPLDAPARPVDVGGDFTLEFWMKTASGNASGACSAGADNWTSGNILFDRNVSGGGDFGAYGVSLFGTGGVLAFGVNRLGTGTTICGATNVANGAWHHVAVTRTTSSGLLRLFVDGQLDASGTGPTGDVSYRDGRSTTHPTTDPFLVIGAEKFDTGALFPSYHGSIDELRISTTLRYSAAFTPPSAPFTTDPSTAALYHFDEGNGNTLTDSALATGGPSNGVRRFGGLPTGPQWTTDTPFTSGAPGIALQTLTSALTSPTSITNCGDNRLFITELGGTVRIWDGTQLLATPFLTVSPIGAGGERGLLSVAFHPLYAQNGFFFVYYTDPSGNVTVARYHVSGNPNVADPNSRVILLSIPHPVSNHNGGQLQFGPDGDLYAGVGDGGGGCDDTNGGCNAQRDDTMLGKMMRVDVNQNVNTPPYYGIPPSNPFVGPGNPRDEVWNKGLRNPFRYSFDRLTKALFIADVGQSAREEVDYQPAESTGGENYGWKIMEGTLCGTCALTGCTSPLPPCTSPPLVLPILEYDHGSGDCAIIGGYAYRGTQVPFMYGAYLYGDLCTGRLLWAAQNSGTWTATQFTPTAGSLTTFGEDVYGEPYLAYGNTLAKIVPGP